jgi:hypothetical protein
MVEDVIQRKCVLDEFGKDKTGMHEVITSEMLALHK